METPAKPDSLKGTRTTALGLLTAAYAFSMTDRLILSILFEPLKAEFSLTDTQLGFLGGLSFAIFYATIGIPIARYADRSNRTRIIVFSLLLFSLMTTLSGFAVSFLMLVILRMLVGIGEAGVNPASHSIIADYYEQEKRPSAMSVWAVGANVGVILGFMIGGYVSQTYGWRAAFYCVGIPGVLLAILIHFVMKEPKRGLSDQADAPQSESTLLETVAYIWQSKALRHLIAGSTITTVVSYGVVQWLPTFFMRIHGLDQIQVGLLLGGVFGILGAAGVIVGGKLFERVSRDDASRGPLFMALCAVCLIPVSAAAYFAEPFALAIAVFLPVAFVSNFFLGVALSLVQTLSRIDMRAKAAALNMLCLNLVGLGLGPLIVGLVSDLFEPAMGINSLRASLAITSLLSIWAAWHLVQLSRHLKDGLAIAKASNPAPASA